MIGVILQARTGSERLPGKSLVEIEGKLLLVHILDRLKLCRLVDKVVVATTEKKEDDEIERVAKEQGVLVFRGSEEDVLDRFYQAAKRFGLDVIVRITGDCPFADPQLINRMVRMFQKEKPDYLSNVLHLTFPDGLDVEIFTFDALEKVWKEAKLPSDREHVTMYIRKHHDLFKVSEVKNDKDLSRMKWSVDTEEDLLFVRKVYALVYKKDRSFTTEDVLKTLREHPELLEINRHIDPLEGYKKSLAKDRKT